MQAAGPAPRSQISTHFAAAQLCACTPGRCSTSFYFALANYAQGSKATRRKNWGHFCLANSLLLHKHLLVVSAHHVNVQLFLEPWISCIANHTASPPTKHHNPICNTRRAVSFV